jgi:transglutaminase-like putative cysteine protease
MSSGSVRLSLAAAVATLLAAAGLFPLLADTSWVAPALMAVALVSGVGIVLRRLSTPAWVVLTAQGVVLALWTGWLVATDVARLGFLPSRAWAQRLVDTYLLGIEDVRVYEAPVPVDDGILLLVVGGVGLVAWAVDALAVTARMAPLAGVPLVILHAVAMATTPGGPTVPAFVAAAAGYLLLLAADGRERARRWGRPLGARANQPATAGSRATSIAAVGVPVGLVAVLVAVTGAAALPQAGLALFGGAGGGDGSRNQTIRTENPIVDLKRDLVSPENVEVIRFTSQVSPPDYLRLLTLDVYDGEVWRTSDRPVPEDNRVSAGMPTPPGLSPSIERTPVEYEFEITGNLQSQWLPLPYPAADVRTESGDWRYDADTLDVVSTDRTTQNLRYDVTALEVQPTSEQLAGLPSLPGPLQAQLTLPSDLPELARDLAREVTADAVDNYERAVALQTWFRSEGGFVYDLAVDPGNGSDDLVGFLEERRGYCEQYAATMAIMARVLGIPARVAVGYLRGEQTQPGYWQVRAQDAHAWPELYFDGVGWVRFEPTPGERTGAPPGYTVPGSEADEQTESATDAEAEDGPDAGAAGVRPLDETLAEGASAGTAPSRLPLLAVLAVLGALALTPLLAGWFTRRRRWLQAGDDPARQAEAAWADIQDAAVEVGVAWNPHDTIRVRAAALRSAPGLGEEAQQRLTDVAQATERARYAASVPANDGLQHDADVVRSALLQTASRRTRWQAALWPAAVRRRFSRRP